MSPQDPKERRCQFLEESALTVSNAATGYLPHASLAAGCLSWSAALIRKNLVEAMSPSLTHQGIERFQVGYRTLAVEKGAEEGLMPRSLINDADHRSRP